MRAGLVDAGFKLLGRASPIVPVVLGNLRLSRLMTKFAIEMGGIVNLVEHPAVVTNRCRWRIQVMADHEAAQISEFVEIAKSARERAAADECSERSACNRSLAAS
jgi:glycine C-acetyltransferase